MGRSPRISAASIGDGGALGWIDPATAEFPGSPAATTCIMQLAYKVSGEAAPQFMSFQTDTSFTQAAIRSDAKDAIQQNILDVFGTTIPKSAIKMSNSLE